MRLRRVVMCVRAWAWHGSRDGRRACLAWSRMGPAPALAFGLRNYCTFVQYRRAVCGLSPYPYPVRGVDRRGNGAGLRPDKAMLSTGYGCASGTDAGIAPQSVARSKRWRCGSLNDPPGTPLWPSLAPRLTHSPTKKENGTGGQKSDGSEAS